MEFREAKSCDAAALREVARASLHASYGDLLGEGTVDDAADRWYDPDRVREDLADDELAFVAADDLEVRSGEESEELAGFAQTLVRDGTGRIQWLHVRPDRRGEGIGGRLLAQVQGILEERGVERVVAEVLADNEAGNEFYREHGFRVEDQRTVEIAGEFHAENVYQDAAAESELQPVDAPEGEMYVDRTDAHRGALAPFYPVYRSRDGTRRYGWLCGNCDSTDNAMDTLDRIECNECGNKHKADRWDAAYL